MNKLLTSGVAALTLVGSGLAAAPASARDWGYGHRNDDAGYAIAGGIVGLALGAVLASHHDHYSNGYYGYNGYDGYYGSGYRYNRYRYNNYNNYDNYNYNRYGYGQPYYGSTYGYGNSYDQDGD